MPETSTLVQEAATNVCAIFERVSPSPASAIHYMIDQVMERLANEGEAIIDVPTEIDPDGEFFNTLSEFFNSLDDIAATEILEEDDQ